MASAPPVGLPLAMQSILEAPALSTKLGMSGWQSGRSLFGPGWTLSSVSGSDPQHTEEDYHRSCRRLALLPEWSWCWEETSGYFDFLSDSDSDVWRWRSHRLPRGSPQTNPSEPSPSYELQKLLPENMSFQDFVRDMIKAILFSLETEDELSAEELEILQYPLDL